MAREINNEYMVPLTGVFPPNRLGPTGDVAKSNCATCHQGAYKPLYGAAMAKHYPGMQAPKLGSGATAATPGQAIPVEPKPEVKAEASPPISIVASKSGEPAK